MSIWKGHRGRTPSILLIAGIGSAAAAGAAIAAGGNANPVPVPNAVIEGGAGTYANAAGAVFAKTGQPLKLKVSGTDVACVTYGTSTDSAAPFEFALTAGATDGLQSVQATAYADKNANGVCNKNSAGASAAYTVDNSAPQLSARLSQSPVNGWNNEDVTLSWSATDASGLRSGPTPATDTVTANTPGTTRTSEATDNLGTRGSGSQLVRLDKTAPSITADLSPAPNRRGWNNTNVAVTFACADQPGLSGVAECPTSRTDVTDEGAAQRVSGTARDLAGNTRTVQAEVAIDKTPPTLAGEPQVTTSSGWHTGDVTIAWSCGDSGGSGIDRCPAESTVTGEGSALSVTETVSDLAGNMTTAASATVRIDRTPPATGATAPRDWTSDAAISLHATDGGSGVATTHFRVDGGTRREYVDGITIAEEGIHSLEYWSVDRAGNPEQPTVIEVKVDKTAPAIGHALSPEPNALGWNNGNVTVSFLCEDRRSGIASCSPESVVTTEGRNQPVVGEARDNAGNSATTTATVSLDRTPPAIHAAADRAPNAAGWYDAEVGVGFTCEDQDHLSGIDSCPAPATVGAGRDQAITRSASDAAGNQASASLAGINVDTQAPTLRGAATTAGNEDRWYRDDVTIAWQCDDDLSGIDGDCPGESLIDGEGDDLGASASIRDVAGNTASESVTGIKIDRHAPVTDAVLPPAVADGWHSGPVMISLEAADNLSEVAATYYRIDGGETQPYTDAFRFDRNGAHELTFWSVDRAGNPEDPTTIDVKLDTIDPTISGAVPAANQHGWYAGSVGVTFACADADSGVKSCSRGVTLTGEGENQSVEGHVEDRVGNRAGTTVDGIDIDLTAPTVTGRPATDANAYGWYRDDVSIDWTCTDGLSGIDGSCPADSAITGEGAALGAGPVTVADRAGNIGSGAVSGISIDRTRPTVSITTPADGSTVTTEEVTVTVAAGDELSGVEVVRIDGAVAQPDGGGNHSRRVTLACGVNTIRALALDRAGNPSQEAARTVVRSCVSFAALSPIATSTGSQGNPSAANLNAFKVKSVVPVKFRVYEDAAKTRLMTAPPAGSYAKLSFGRYDGSTDSIDSADLVSAGSANTDGQFRWTGSPDHQYVYNLSTAGRSAGTYAVQLVLYSQDGTLMARSAPQYLVLR